MSELAKTLRRVRLQLGLTQEHFGALIGLSAQAVSRWEKAKARPTGPKRKALVEAVGLRNRPAADRLAMALSEEPPPPPPEPKPQPSNETRQNELLLTLMQASEELDLPPRRLRGTVGKILRHAHSAGYSLEALVQAVEERPAGE